MLKNIKNKIIIIIGIILIMIGVIYNINQKREQDLDIDYSNIVAEVSEEAASTIEEDTEKEIEYIKIHVAGCVKNPGLIELESGSRISDAIEKAGGTTETADLNNVNLAYCLEDGQKLYIPSIEEKNVEYIIEENGEDVIQETKTSGSGKKLNINKASMEELEKVPGIGPSMSKKIVDYRTENGEFKLIEDLKNVSGIGEKKLDSIKEYICIK